MKNIFQIEFTGERMIPKINKDKTLYYEHLARYLFCLQFVKNKKVIDLGCGTGYGSYLIAGAGALRVEGIDISEDAINYAEANFKKRKIVFIVGDVQKISRQEDFDLAVAFEVIEHLNYQKEFLEMIKKMLSRNGILIISTPNKKKSRENNPFHIKEFDYAEFREILKKNFRYVHIFGQSFSFANIINSEKSDIGNYNLRFLDKFKMLICNIFMPEFKINNSMYLVAVCSNKRLQNIQSTALVSSSVDEFSLENGVEGLTKKFVIERRDEVEALQESINNAKRKIDNLQDRIDKITHSKFFIFWKIYNKCKKILQINMRSDYEDGDIF